MYYKFITFYKIPTTTFNCFVQDIISNIFIKLKSSYLKFDKKLITRISQKKGLAYQISSKIDFTISNSIVKKKNKKKNSIYHRNILSFYFQMQIVEYINKENNQVFNASMQMRFMNNSPNSCAHHCLAQLERNKSRMQK